MKMKIKLDDGAVMPTRAHEYDAGLDLYARGTKWAFAGDNTRFDTGVHVQIPEGYVGLLTAKSGLMAKGITSRGTIDSGYTGSISVILSNAGEDSYLVKAGDKISQLLILPCERPELDLVEELEETERGADGFGSTGR